MSDGDGMLAGHRLLVVEDEELISLMLVDLLEELGATVIGPASSVADALALLEGESPSGALLDLSLRGETAYPIADQLLDRQVPYIFITGYGQGHLVARHAQAPVLTKPFGADQLAQVLAQAGWKAPHP